jgi:hypothetical protein
MVGPLREELSRLGLTQAAGGNSNGSSNGGSASGAPGAAAPAAGAAPQQSKQPAQEPEAGGSNWLASAVAGLGSVLGRTQPQAATPPPPPPPPPAAGPNGGGLPGIVRPQVPGSDWLLRAAASSRNVYRSPAILGVCLKPRPCVMVSVALPPGHRAARLKTKDERLAFFKQYGHGLLPLDALVCLATPGWPLVFATVVRRDPAELAEVAPMVGLAFEEGPQTEQVLQRMGDGPLLNTVLVQVRSLRHDSVARHPGAVQTVDVSASVAHAPGQPYVARSHARTLTPRCCGLASASPRPSTHTHTPPPGVLQLPQQAPCAGVPAGHAKCAAG